MSVDLNSLSQDSPVPSYATHTVLFFIHPSLFFSSVCFLFIFSSPSPSSIVLPALSHAFIIVFYLCHANACRKIAHPVLDNAGLCFSVLFFLNFSESLLDSNPPQQQPLSFTLLSSLYNFGYSAFVLWNVQASLVNRFVHVVERVVVLLCSFLPFSFPLGVIKGMFLHLIYTEMNLLV